MEAVLRQQARDYRHWLFEHVLPLWWEIGADHVRGGFCESIDQTGRPTEAPRRMRVPARQVFVYAEAGRLGWAGPWPAAVIHGLDSLERFYRRPDGFYRTLVSADGAILDDSVDLYDQAFVLLALAHGYDALGRPAALLRRAEGLLDRLIVRFAHPARGFEEARPARLPLRSNPHMHLLEALLAWVSFGVEGSFRERAAEIVALAGECLIDPDTGSIGEYFDAGWRPVAGSDGHLREPGHQFEWAFLLREAETWLGLPAGDRPARLRAFGETRGLAATGAAVFSVTDQGAVLDGSARLWAQTERLRTSLVFADLDAAESALTVLNGFLKTDIPGLWLDRMLDDGTLVRTTPAPASTLYHLVTVARVLLQQFDAP